jgi:hypothetical protein
MNYCAMSGALIPAARTAATLTGEAAFARVSKNPRLMLSGPVAGKSWYS